MSHTVFVQHITTIATLTHTLFLSCFFFMLTAGRKAVCPNHAAAARDTKHNNNRDRTAERQRRQQTSPRRARRVWRARQRHGAPPPAGAVCAAAAADDVHCPDRTARHEPAERPLGPSLVTTSLPSHTSAHTTLFSPHIPQFTLRKNVNGQPHLRGHTCFLLCSFLSLLFFFPPPQLFLFCFCFQD